MNKQVEDEELVRCCSECDGSVEEKFSGDEGWTVCDGCGNVEGDTYEITLTEYEARP